ncbi:MAG: hypothetical protein AB1813_20600 [Verrucomicrobiota bacterium]|jgi:hypothetical protein
MHLISPAGLLGFVPFDWLQKLPLSGLAIGIGLLFSVPQLFGLLKPASFAEAARKFPRDETWGYFLMALGTLWFLSNLSNEAIADFAAYKKPMMIGFAAVGLLTCIYVKDFLAVRGLAIVILLLSKLMLDTARWHDSQWRLVVSIWAYVWIVAAMWFTISPWRLRDLIHWMTASEHRIRVGSAVRLGLGLFLAALGLFVF